MVNKANMDKMSRSTILSAAFFTLALFCLVFAIAVKDAHALRITLKRVIFEGPKRTEVITIINNTAEEQVYRLGWRRMRMTEDKSLQAVADDDPAPDLRPADSMIRYAPRRIVLPPGRTQQIRLLLRRPKDMEPGEYRSHLWIQPEESAVKFDPNKPKAQGQAVQIKMLTGLTLPVFIRSGKLEAAVRIEDAVLTTKKGKPIVSYTVYREGNRSVYGDIEITCQSAGEEVVISSIRGIAVYTDVTKRNINNAVLSMPEAGCSSMKITYRASEEDNFFKGDVMAEAAVKLN